MRKLGFAAGISLLAVALLVLGALRPVAGSSGERVVPGSIEALEAEVAAGTAGAEDLAAVALDRLARLRSHADPTVIPIARRLLQRSLELEPNDNYAAALGMASLSNASHDFSGSVRWSREAIRINPYAAAPLGTLGDALFELGRTDAADGAYQRMVDLRPDVGSYVRASYAAQSHGDHRRAVYALKLALDAAPAVGEERAWIYHQLGDVYASVGDHAASERANRTGADLAPGYVPPLVGIAESYIARGRYEDALPIMRNAARDLPALEYLVTLGDLLFALGDEDAAAATYGRAAERLALYRGSGVLPDHDFVLFYADHGVRGAAALREARAIYENRPTAAAADTLAWALHAQGRDREALRFARRSLRSASVPDATAHFHAAAIADSLGERAMARRLAREALELDPRFSLFHLRYAERLAR